MPQNQQKVGNSNEDARSTDINCNENDIFIEQFSFDNAIIRNDCILPNENIVSDSMVNALDDYLNDSSAISLDNISVLIDTNHIKSEYIEAIGKSNGKSH